MIHKYRKLEEVPIYCRDDDSDRTLFLLNPKILDPGIVNLVRALQSINIETNASCDGHLDSEGHQHPWIGFDHYGSYEDVLTLRSLLKIYNEAERINWRIIDGNWILPFTYRELCTSCHNKSSKRIDIEKLSELQQDSEKLAQYIFENRMGEI